MDRNDDAATVPVDCEGEIGLNDAKALPTMSEDKVQGSKPAAMTVTNQADGAGSGRVKISFKMPKKQDKSTANAVVLINRKDESDSDGAANLSTIFGDPHQLSSEAAISGNQEYPSDLSTAHTESIASPCLRNGIELNDSHGHDGNLNFSKVTPSPPTPPTPSPHPPLTLSRGDSSDNTFAPSSSKRYQIRGHHYRRRTYNGTSPYSARRRNRTIRPQSVSRLKDNGDRKNQEEDNFDSDNADMSLAILIKLESDLKLLKSFLTIYKEFNARLGDWVSGVHHKGLLTNIAQTITRIEEHVKKLDTLRQERQRGSPEPGEMELTASSICKKFNSLGKQLYRILNERVNMCDDIERSDWLNRKDEIIIEVVFGMSAELEQLDMDNNTEVADMVIIWRKKWSFWAEPPQPEKKAIGWIDDIDGKRRK